MTLVVLTLGVTVDERIYPKIYDILMEVYKDDHKAGGIIYQLKSKNITAEFYKPIMLKENATLKAALMSNEKLLSYVVNVFDPRKKKFNGLKLKVLQWYPHFSTFIDEFLKFLWREGVQKPEVDRLKKNEKEFQKKVQPRLKKYAENATFQNGVHEAIKLHLLNILRNDSITPEKNEIFNNSIKNQDKNKQLDLLFNRVKLKEISESYFKSYCLTWINKKTTNMANFKLTECIEKEICTQQICFTDTCLTNRLKAYQKNKIATATKIKDEIDGTIFDIIRESLKTKKNINADCIFEYIIRDDPTGEFYNPELFFNEKKLNDFIGAKERSYKSRHT